jgi:hypothetical protein
VGFSQGTNQEADAEVEGGKEGEEGDEPVRDAHSDAADGETGFAYETVGPGGGWGREGLSAGKEEGNSKKKA